MTRPEEPHPSDARLLAGIARGEEEPFRILFKRWAPRLGRFLQGTTGSRETAEDLLQEAFLRILKAAPAFEPRGKAGSWMYRICANLAYSHWRRVRRARQAARDETGVCCDLLGSAGSDPQERHAGSSFAAHVEAALGRLPENQRMVFLLKVDQGLTYEEVARVLACPVGTTKSRFHHAVRKLRTDLKVWDERPDVSRRSPDVL